MTSILYISYTGLMDPLGQSQVLQYVLALSLEGHRMTVLSFEKPDFLEDKDRCAALRAQCDAAGVIWFPLIWHNKPLSSLATLYDFVIGQRHAIRLAHEVRADIVHCRSYIAGLMGLAVKRKTGARLIFDMRGFWPDERVDGGIWSKYSLAYLIFKGLERKLFVNSDHIVSLTKAGIKEYRNFDYLKGLPKKSTVIPTCTNLEIFRIKELTRKSFTLGYVGSVGSWYLFHEVAFAVSRLFDILPESKFLVVTQGNRDFVINSLSAAGVDLNRVEIVNVEFLEVPNQIARMDAGIFFIRPARSKRASCPTRMGEFLACGKPCLTNGGVGDVSDDLHETGTGVALPPIGLEAVDLSNLDNALKDLFLLASDPKISARCRAVAKDRFSLASGVESYSKIYNTITGP